MARVGREPWPQAGRRCSSNLSGRAERPAPAAPLRRYGEVTPKRASREGG